MVGGETCDDGNTGVGDGCACSGTKSLGCISEVEPNDAPAFAGGPLPKDVFAYGSDRNSMVGVDYFSFTLPATGDLVISPHNGSGDNFAYDIFIDTMLERYDLDGQMRIGPLPPRAFLRTHHSRSDQGRWSP